MSFSNDAKNEVSKIKLESSKLMLAELSGLIRMCTNIKFNKGGVALDFITENASVARRIFTFLKGYSSDVEAYIKKNTQLKKNNNYIISMTDKYSVDDLLYDTDFVHNSEYLNRNYKIGKKLMGDYESLRAYMRGTFLGAGSVTNPEKGYHLELIANDIEHAEDLKYILNSIGLNAKIAERKTNYIIYLKEAEQISDFMALIGANQSLLKFENVRIVKELRNSVNRLVNCETANLNKTVDAATKQVADIEYLMDKGKFNTLPEDLQEIGLVRLDNHDSSLMEIVDLLNSKYSKSGINYRLKKISNIAAKLRGVNNERNESDID